MPNTITSYIIFAAGTKAKSAEVSGNFSNHRGDLLPINENTATASNQAHDLGSPDHFWAEGYIGKINFGITTTAIATVTANTSGGLDFAYATTTSINNISYGATTLVSTEATGTSIILNFATTTGKLDIHHAGATTLSINNNGIVNTDAFNDDLIIQQKLQNRDATTGSAAVGQYTRVDINGTFGSTTAQTITTLTLATTGRPVSLRCFGVAASVIGPASTGAQWFMTAYRDTTTNVVGQVAGQAVSPPSAVGFIDFIGETTTVKYSFAGGSNATNVGIVLTNVRFIANEE